MSASLPQGYHIAKQLATWLDTAWTVPIIRKKVGLDPLLNSIPIVGSLVGGALSLYVVFLAVQLKLPAQIIAQMIMNILIDVTIGELPLVGALVDAMWCSNSRNLALLEKAHRQVSAIPIQPL